MRALDLEATMRAVQILDTLGKTEDIKAAINGTNGKIDGKLMVNVGIDLIAGMCRKNVAEDTVGLLAYIFGMSPEEARKTPITEYKKLFKQLAEENDLTVFFKTCMS